MLTSHRDPIPPYIADAIPGAAPILAAVEEAEATLAAANDKLTTTSAAASAMSGDNIHDPSPRPRPGVATATFSKALDAFRLATDDAKRAELALYRAQKARYEYVLDGMATAEFKARQEDLADGVIKDAERKMNELRGLLVEHTELCAVLGRPTPLPLGWWGIRDALAQVEAYVIATRDAGENEAYRHAREGARLAKGGEAETALTVLLRSIRENDLTLDEKRKAYADSLARYGVVATAAGWEAR